MYAGDARASLSVTSSSSSRVVSSDGSRDAFWERVLLALPDSLLSALRAGDLDGLGVLCEYPKLSVEELMVVLGEMLEEDAASLGAATSWTTGTTMLEDLLGYLCGYSSGGILRGRFCGVWLCVILGRLGSARCFSGS